MNVRRQPAAVPHRSRRRRPDPGLNPAPAVTRRPGRVGDLVILALVSLAATWPPVSPAAGAPWGGRGGPADHVVLVDWDGFDPDYLERARTPTLSALARRGRLVVARTPFPTVSNPVRASTATGALPRTHGNSAYYYDRKADVAVGQGRYLAAETIAEVVSSAGGTLASVQWYIVHGHGARYGDSRRLYVEPGGPCSRRIDVAIDILEGRPVDSNGTRVTTPAPPDLLAVYCSDLDALGHREGPGSPALPVLLEEMDRHLGRLVQATKDAGLYHRTAFVLTSDHGMTAWDRSAVPRVVTALADAGYRPEVVPAGRSADPETEVILVPDALRVAAVTLRHRAATPGGRAEVGALLDHHPEIDRVLDPRALDELGADPVADLVVEARPPWSFAPTPPGDRKPRGAHGSTTEAAVPLLLAGAGIEGHEVVDDARIVDVAPTIAALLGLAPPASAEGRNLIRHGKKGDGWFGPFGPEERPDRAGPRPSRPGPDPTVSR